VRSRLARTQNGQDGVVYISTRAMIER